MQRPRNYFGGTLRAEIQPTITLSAKEKRGKGAEEKQAGRVYFPSTPFPLCTSAMPAAGMVK
jgi:hypothetical protein